MSTTTLLSAVSLYAAILLVYAATADPHNGRQCNRAKDAENGLSDALEARDAAMRGAKFASEELYGAEERS